MVTPADHSKDSEEMALLAPVIRPIASHSVRPRLRRDSLLVLAGNVVAGASNYGFTLALVWILPGRQFSRVASLSALLLVVGTAAQAAIPWVIAREVVRRSPNDPARGHAVGFALIVAVVLGMVSAGAIYGLSERYAGTSIELAAMGASPAIFVAQVGAGYLQGTGQFLRYALLISGEALVRLACGATLAWRGDGALGGVSGFTAGAVIAALISLWVVRREVSWPRRTRGLMEQLGGIGGVQLAVSVLSTLDVIVASLLHGASRSLAAYQALLIFTRVPLFISGALSAVVYPRLVVRHRTDDASTVTDSTKMLLVVSALAAVGTSSLPRVVLTHLLPQGYASSINLLVPLAIAGAASGQINFSTTLLQARSQFAPALKIVGVGIPLAAILLGFASSSMYALGWSAAGIDVVIAGSLVLVTGRRFPGSSIVRMTVLAVVVTGALIAAFASLRSTPSLWVLCLFLLAVSAVLVSRWRIPAGQDLGA